jgi:ATP-dependent DNA helicase RecG
MNKGDLDFNTTIILDKIQKNKIDEIDKKDLKKLKEQRLIEKIEKSYFLSKKVAEILGKETEYTEKKGFPDDFIIDKIIKHLEHWNNGQTRQQINDLVWKYLPGILSDQKKTRKINNILTKLSKENRIKNFGNRKKSNWKLVIN